MFYLAVTYLVTISSGLEIVLEHIVVVWKKNTHFHTTDRAIFRGAYPRSLDRASSRYAPFCAMVRARVVRQLVMQPHPPPARQVLTSTWGGWSYSRLTMAGVVRIGLAIYEVYSLDFSKVSKVLRFALNLRTFIYSI